MLPANQARTALFVPLIAVLTAGVAPDARCPAEAGGAAMRWVPAAPVPVIRTPLIRTKVEPDMFPVSWRLKMVATPLSATHRAWAPAAVREALSYYPAGLVRRYVRRIYVMDRLYLSGMGIGGTRSLDRIYLAAGTATRHGGHSLARRLHAELSSILMMAHPSFLDEPAWRRANPPTFRYVGSGVTAVRQGRTSLEARSDLLARGFLHTYAMSSLENDFNAVASALFTSEQTLAVYARTSPRLRKKVELTKRFYRLVHPWFAKRFPAALEVR